MFRFYHSRLLHLLVHFFHLHDAPKQSNENFPGINNPAFIMTYHIIFVILQKATFSAKQFSESKKSGKFTHRLYIHPAAV